MRPGGVKAWHNSQHPFPQIFTTGCWIEKKSLSYSCDFILFFSITGQDTRNTPSWGWWVGRTNLNMRYWGGSSPGSGMCACALTNECRKNSQTCNCDAEDGETADEGYLRHKVS